MRSMLGRSLSVSLPVTVAFALVAFGCARADGLQVHGDATLEVDGTEAGFSFAQDTALAPLGTRDGRIEGACALPQTSDGKLRVTLARSGPGEGISVEKILIEANPDHGTLVISTAASTFQAERSGSCRIEEGYRAEDMVAIDIDCEVADENGTRGHARADLHFSGCSDAI
jgi:hypothetical protein